MRAKAKLFQQAGGGLKKQCKKLEPHNNIKTSKFYIILPSQLFLIVFCSLKPFNSYALQHVFV